MHCGDTAYILPQEVIQGAGTRRRLGVDLVISSVPTNWVFPETKELLFVSQHAPIVGVTDVIRVGQPLHIVLVFTCRHQYFRTLFTYNLPHIKSVCCIKHIIVRLTVSGEQVPEVDGDGDPVLAQEGVSVAPDTDIHRASSRLWSQTSEVDGILSKVVHAPALSFISRKSSRKYLI